MKYENKVMLCGNIARDPETKTVGSGSTVAKFTIAHNRKYKDKSGEQKQEATFIDCEAWNKCAEQISNYRKGDGVYVEGALKVEQWDDKDTGKKRYKTKVLVFLVAPPLEWDDRKQTNAADRSDVLVRTAKGKGAVAAAPSISEDDIPL